jgi:ribosome maturation factor RimP
MNAFDVFTGKIVKVETRSGKVTTGRVTALDDAFVELTHRNGAKSLISYESIAEMAEIPGR